MFLSAVFRFVGEMACVACFCINGDGSTGTIMVISKERVKPLPSSSSWKLNEIFTTGIVLGGYLGLTRVIFFWAAYETKFCKVEGTPHPEKEGQVICKAEGS